MKTQISPIAAVIGIVVAVLVIGAVVWMRAGGGTVSKGEASGDRMGDTVDVSKLNQAAANSGVQPSTGDSQRGDAK